MKILITGGAGFIGSNLAAELSKEYKVTVFDSLERGGSEKNKKWLAGMSRDGKSKRSLEFVKGAITDVKLVKKLVQEADAVLHLAAQVAVTTSVEFPRRDFEVNALGTFNIVEAARQTRHKPLIVFSSTNKVYGRIDEEGLVEKKKRYVDTRHPTGIDEEQPLDFYSPYGCSKGIGDSYVKDYGRIYGLPTVVLRKSCIYGPRQFGTEDQGWVAYFIRAALNKEPITIYGNGKQVRDLLYIDDLVELYRLIVHNYRVDKSGFKNGVYNVGGGKENAISLLELLSFLQQKLDYRIEKKFANWRSGDQKVYISDIAKVKSELNWEPKTRIEQGLTDLIEWIRRVKP